MLRLFSTLGYLFITTFLFGQQIIQLQNPSFEDMPQTGKAPVGWYDCGFPGESEPDVQPSEIWGGFFGVTQVPSDGSTYIGMVVRDNDTWEMVGQRLSQPLQNGKNYHCTIDLCRSALYKSLSRKLEKVVNYTSPIKLRIWGGNDYCSKKQLLAETPVIINTDWLKYNFVFTPNNDFQYILLECFYKTPIIFPYNGNLLMDNLSPIVETSMEVADSLKILAPQTYGSVEFPDRPPRPTFSQAQIDSIDVANRQWAIAGVFTDTIQTFLKEMEIDLAKEAFAEETKIQLNKLLIDLAKNREYKNKIVIFGILGDKKRRKQLKQPVYNFMDENNLDYETIQVAKVPVGDLDENWVGKNKYYWIRLE